MEKGDKLNQVTKLFGKSNEYYITILYKNMKLHARDIRKKRDSYLSLLNGLFGYYVDIASRDLVDGESLSQRRQDWVVEEMLNGPVRDCCKCFCNCYSKLISVQRKDARKAFMQYYQIHYQEKGSKYIKLPREPAIEKPVH